MVEVLTQNSDTKTHSFPLQQLQMKKCLEKNPYIFHTEKFPLKSLSFPLHFLEVIKAQVQKFVIANNHFSYKRSTPKLSSGRLLPLLPRLALQ